MTDCRYFLIYLQVGTWASMQNEHRNLLKSVSSNIAYVTVFVTQHCHAHRLWSFASHICVFHSTFIPGHQSRCTPGRVTLWQVHPAGNRQGCLCHHSPSAMHEKLRGENPGGEITLSGLNRFSCFRYLCRTVCAASLWYPARILGAWWLPYLLAAALLRAMNSRLNSMMLSLPTITGRRYLHYKQPIHVHDFFTV